MRSLRTRNVRNMTCRYCKGPVYSREKALGPWQLLRTSDGGGERRVAPLLPAATAAPRNSPADCRHPRILRNRGRGISIPRWRRTRRTRRRSSRPLFPVSVSTDPTNGAGDGETGLETVEFSLLFQKMTCWVAPVGRDEKFCRCYAGARARATKT